MNKIEARILVYLSQTKKIKHSVHEINRKLDYEYSYLCRTLRNMKTRKLVTRIGLQGQLGRRECFYDLRVRGVALTVQAKVFLSKK